VLPAVAGACWHADRFLTVGYLQLMRIWLLLALTACGHHEVSGPDQPPKMMPLGDTGLAIDAPANWDLSQRGDTFRLDGGGDRKVWFTPMPVLAKTAAEYYKEECGKVARGPGVSELTPHGAFYAQCTVATESRDGKAAQATYARSIVKGMRCRFESTGDPTAQIAVCKSLRAM
jgi:hypothetical protein